MRFFRIILPPLALLLAALAQPAAASPGGEVQKRISSDLASGKPLVVHVTVALSEGGAGKPLESPWWKGPNGLSAVLGKSGWRALTGFKPVSQPIFERAVYTRKYQRAGREETVYLVADGWEEKSIQKALTRFYAHARGAEAETVTVSDGGRSVTLAAGGDSHLVVYMGRNGMEDVEPVDDDTYNISPEEEWLRRAAARPDSAYDIRPKVTAEKTVAAAALCSDSKAYFLDKLKRQGAYPHLLTVGIQTPSAWALEAAVASLAAGKVSDEARASVVETVARGTGASREAVRLKLWSGD